MGRWATRATRATTREGNLGFTGGYTIVPGLPGWCGVVVQGPASTPGQVPKVFTMVVYQTAAWVCCRFLKVPDGELGVQVPKGVVGGVVSGMTGLCVLNVSFSHSLPLPESLLTEMGD